MAHFAKFVSLARTPDELKADAEKMGIGGSVPSKVEQPIYPYGLCINLDEETIKKLKLDTDDCEVGSTIHICCMATVTDFGQRKMNDGVNRRIELQITDLALENEDEENAPAFSNHKRMKQRYGIKSSGDEGEEDEE
jgi:hypothetical protein